MKFLKDLFNQPKAVFLLSFVQMWNRFSHYGMRALLMLFMLHHLHLATGVALGVYAVFCALVELGGVFGTYFADKFLGLRRTIILGGWIVAFGHLSLAMDWFYPGLALLIVGSSLFSTNITALMGNFYTLNDERRSSGFTLFYMGINIGAFFATLLCGFLAEAYGWSWGFGVAAFGMLIANLVLLKYRHLLENKGEPAAAMTPAKKLLSLPLLIGAVSIGILALVGQKFSLPLLPFLAGGLGFVLLRSLWKKNVNLAPLILSLSALILFFSAEEQFGSSMIVYADKMMSHTAFGIPMAATSILALNPVVIILLGALASGLYHRLSHPFVRILAPFLLTAGAFAGLVLTHFLIPSPTFLGMMAVVGVISFAELLVGPMAYSACSRVSCEAQDPKIMGLVPIGFSLAASFGGGMSKLIAESGYDTGFLTLALLLILGGLILGFSNMRSSAAKIPH